MAKKTPAPTKTKQPRRLLTRRTPPRSARPSKPAKGILRLAPTWVPRSFLMPGRRIKLAPQDVYALGAHRGGIDERWFASTTPAANEEPRAGRGAELRRPRRQAGLHAQGRRRRRRGRRWSGRPSGSKYQRWPVYSKFFDNLGPIPHHMHQNNAQAAKVGQQGKPESYYFPPQLNALGNNFPYTFFGLEPGTTKDDIRRCLERLEQGRQRHPQLQQGVPPATRHRLAGAAVRPARPRLAGDLRAAVGFRRVRHVSVAGRGPAGAVGACSSRTCPRTSTTTSNTSSSSSTGKATSIRTSRTAIISNRSPWPTRPRRATSIAGSSTARWTARNCSPPRN